jgi:hypothetical protein
MSVDGIGSGGGPPKVGGGGSADFDAKVREAAPGFELQQAEAAPEPGPTTSLERLHRGEIDLEQYLDVRVDQAVEHLGAAVPAEQLAFIRQSLKSQMRTDPVLVELVRRATGMGVAESDD